MKRIIRASKELGATERLHRFIDNLQDEGVDEHSMFDFLLDNMTSEEGLKLMKKLADLSDVDYSEWGL